MLDQRKPKRRIAQIVNAEAGWVANYATATAGISLNIGRVSC